MGAGPRGPRWAEKGGSAAHTQGLDCSAVSTAGFLPSLPFSTPQTRNCELFCCWVANKNITSAFQYLLAPGSARAQVLPCEQDAGVGAHARLLVVSRAHHDPHVAGPRPQSAGSVPRARGMIFIEG